MNELDCIKIRMAVDDLTTEEMPQYMASHISRCMECHQYTKKLSDLRAMLRDSHRVTAPDDFDARLRERLQNRSSRATSIWSFIPTPALAAAATFAITATITFAVLKYHHAVTDMQAVNPQPVSNEVAKKEEPNTTQPTQNVAASEPTSPVVETPSRRTVSAPARVSYNQTGRNTMSEIPDVTILVRGQQGEQVMRVPQVIIGSKSIVPRGSAARRPQYEPSVF